MIYLDSAATSLMKPPAVGSAVLRAMKRMASPGRGGHRPAMEAAECCYRCRERAAALFHVSEPDRVVLTFNATHGLNIAIKSLTRPGGRVLISGYEHNSVLRPLYAAGSELTVIRTPLFDADALMEEAERQIAEAELVVSTHVSNVFGYILPVERLAALCHSYGKPLIVDASQSAGVLSIDFEKLGADFVAMPGHKGLMGPQGTGLLLCKNDASPLLYGGSGSASRLRDMPPQLPDRLEAGTPNVTGIAGLSESLAWLQQNGVAEIRRHEWTQLRALAHRLSEIDDLQIFDSGQSEMQSGVLSVLPRSMDCEALAETLAQHGVAVRAGLHCAPLAHETAGTIGTGTVRFSFSPFLTVREIESAASICKKILKNG